MIKDEENPHLNINGLQLQSLIFELASDPNAETMFRELLEEQKRAKLEIDLMHEEENCWVEYKISFQANKKVLEEAVQKGQIYSLAQELAIKSLSQTDPCIQVKFENHEWEF